MGRQQRPEIADKLLDACTDFALRDGLPDRLDPLARATGTSARMLLYHFGTRDELLRQILQRARQRQLNHFGQWLQPRAEENYTVTLARAWTAMTGPGGQPYLRLFSQLREDTEQTLWPGFRRVATTDWLQPLVDGLRTIGRAESATLVLAVIRGLLIDKDSTADNERTNHAFNEFLETLKSASRSPGTPGP